MADIVMPRLSDTMEEGTILRWIGQEGEHIQRGQELITAHLVGAGEPVAVEEARLSTVYDGDGRQRSAGLELWLPAEDFPRRAVGTVQAGLSLSLEGLRVHVAVFAWRMEGRDGLGAYDVTVRDEPAAAA